MTSYLCCKVRSAVANNPNTHQDVIWLLAADEQADVRFSLAANPLVPMAILQSLLVDDNPYVACRAEATLRRLRTACRLDFGIQLEQVEAVA